MFNLGFMPNFLPDTVTTSRWNQTSNSSLAGQMYKSLQYGAIDYTLGPQKPENKTSVFDML